MYFSSACYKLWIQFSGERVELAWTNHLNNYHVAASEVNTDPVQTDLYGTAAGILGEVL